MPVQITIRNVPAGAAVELWPRISTDEVIIRMKTSRDSGYTTATP